MIEQYYWKLSALQWLIVVDKAVLLEIIGMAVVHRAVLLDNLGITEVGSG